MSEKLIAAALEWAELKDGVLVHRRDGKFRNSQPHKAGDPLTLIKHSSGYRTVWIAGDKRLAHQVVWALHYKTWPDCGIDHINGDPADNRIENLRLATQAQNCLNRGSNKRGTSKYKGVSWDASRRQWVAQIKINGVSRRKRFMCEDTAALWYNKQAEVLHGDFARLNNVE